MAIQEGGWPLGLQPLNVRMGPVRNVDFSRSMSFSTLISGSPTSSTDSSSSDTDTESTGSFFHGRSITLGRLIGITSILELSASGTGSFSSRRQRQDSVRSSKGGQRPRACFFFSLCARTGAVDGKAAAAADKAAPSLGHFLAVERRAGGTAHRRNHVPAVTYELVGVPESQPAAESESNSLFSNGCIAPPGGATGEVLEPSEGEHSGDLCRHSNGYEMAKDCADDDDAKTAIFELRKNVMKDHFSASTHLRSSAIFLFIMSLEIPESHCRDLLA